MKIYDEEETVISRAVEEPTAAAAVAGDEGAPEISLFLPVLNEEPNLRPLHAKIDEALAHLGRTAEIIYVDDGSTDGSLEVLRGLSRLDPRVRLCRLAPERQQKPFTAQGFDDQPRVAGLFGRRMRALDGRRSLGHAKPKTQVVGQRNPLARGLRHRGHSAHRRRLEGTVRPGLCCNFWIEKKVHALGACFNLQIRTPAE